MPPIRREVAAIAIEGLSAVLVLLFRTAIITTGTLGIGALSGCTGYNQSLQTLQFYGGTQALPSDYRAVALSAVNAWQVAPGHRLEISRPQKMVGKSPYDPQRWYVCVHGIEPPTTPPTADKPLLQSIEESLDPPRTNGVYEIIVVLDGDARPWTIGAFDAGLCKRSVFETAPAAS